MLSTLCFLGVLFVAQDQPAKDLAQLTEGVATVAKPGLPGVVSAISPDAVSFIMAIDGKALVPVASAGRLGRGKIVAFGHGGYLSADAIKDGDTGRLLTNVIRWASRRTSAIKVGCLRNDAAWIQALGFEAVNLRRGELATDLPNVDVAVLPADGDGAALERFVQQGGGLISAHTPWGWLQLNPGKDLATQMPLQGLLHKAGLSFSDGTADRVWPTKSIEESNRANAAVALDNLDKDSAQATTAILAAFRSTTAAEPFNQKARSVASPAGVAYPTLDKPLEAKDGIARLALAVRWLDRQNGRPSPSIEPSAGDFPGSTPPSSRVEAHLQIPLDRRQWVSTGLYAAAGDEISISIPPSIDPSGISLQIGCHTDELWHLDKWQRHPQITVRKPLARGVTRLSSPFGGLIYVVVDRPAAGQSIEADFANVVRSARFVRGKTSPAEWRRQLQNVAPWAEIGSDRLIFSIPIEAARKVEDPEALMAVWDRAIALYGDLDGNPLFDRPERIVCDRQISAGYMHSGYPIMTWMDKSVPLSLDAKALVTEGTWGHWHELGHNRQKSEWTFGGTGEVTNNIFTLYMMEKIAGKSIWERIGSEKPKVEAYLAKGGDFEHWKREPFLALYMYGLLIKDFGWDSMKKYFRSYGSGPLPKTDLEKHDQFMIHYSQIAGRNLGPFFQAWAVPTSQAARDSIKNLPNWMPKDLPGKPGT